MQRTLLFITIISVAFASFMGGLHARTRLFDDVSDDHWAKVAIDYVVDNNLMKGTSWTTFEPDTPLTRAQLAMVLYRQAQNANPQPYVPPYDDNEYVPPVYDPATIDDDKILGKETARITLIEFGDYQCPFCKRHFDDTLPLIKKNYIDTGKVRMVFRDYPLSFHVNAYAAAEASECADEQDKFWEMHYKLYENQADWMDLADPRSEFKAYAYDLNLDIEEFVECYDEGKMEDEIADDMDDGTESGISGTPGFWILGPNGQSEQISGAYPYETFKAAFDEMLD